MILLILWRERYGENLALKSSLALFLERCPRAHMLQLYQRETCVIRGTTLVIPLGIEMIVDKPAHLLVCAG
jgi:hypothetical protein